MNTAAFVGTVITGGVVWIVTITIIVKLVAGQIGKR